MKDVRLQLEEDERNEPRLMHLAMFKWLSLLACLMTGFYLLEELSAIKVHVEGCRLEGRP